MHDAHAAALEAKAQREEQIRIDCAGALCGELQRLVELTRQGGTPFPALGERYVGPFTAMRNAAERLLKSHGGKFVREWEMAHEAVERELETVGEFESLDERFTAAALHLIGLLSAHYGLAPPAGRGGANDPNPPADNRGNADDEPATVIQYADWLGEAADAEDRPDDVGGGLGPATELGGLPEGEGPGL